MSAGGPLLWMGQARERKILDICGNHMKKVVETVVGMDKAVQGFCKLRSKEVEEGFQKAFKSEREADGIKRNILDELSSGIIHPINREEIIRLTMTADEIAANAKAAAKKLRYVDPKKLHQKLRDSLKTISTELVKTSNRTYEAFAALSKDSKTAVVLSQDVERLEEKIDDLRTDVLIPEMLIWWRKSKDVGNSILFKEIIDNIENAADFCEDVSDIIRSIAIGHI